jgi:hypothetical protein
MISRLQKGMLNISINKGSLIPSKQDMPDDKTNLRLPRREPITKGKQGVFNAWIAQ